MILEAAPVSLDGATLAHGAACLRDKLKGVAPAGTAFNLDPIGALMRDGRAGATIADGRAFRRRACAPTCPTPRALRVDARPVHEAGGTEAQEIADGAWLRHRLSARTDARQGFPSTHAAKRCCFAVSVGPDVLIEAAKLRALRLCWARVLEASGAKRREQRARTSTPSPRKRMMTRYDA